MRLEIEDLLNILKSNKKNAEFSYIWKNGRLSNTLNINLQIPRLVSNQKKTELFCKYI